MTFEAKDKDITKGRAGNRVQILGVGVDSTSSAQVLEMLNAQCTMHKNKPFFVVTVNPEFVIQAQSDIEFREILNKADLAIADGAGLRWGGYRGEVIPGRKLVEALVESGKYKIFYLGGRNGVAEDMARKSQIVNRGSQQAWDIGHEDIRSTINDQRTSERIIKKINTYKPDILLVAYGAPWQEKWIWKNRNRLKAKVAIGVGGAFDYLTGRAKLPPKFIERYSLEWLWRLINEPWRWKRQLRLMEFVYRLILANLRRV